MIERPGQVPSDPPRAPRAGGSRQPQGGGGGGALAMIAVVILLNVLSQVFDWGWIFW